MRKIYPYIIVLISLFIVGCATPSGGTDSDMRISIAYLKSLCKGDSYRIVDDFVISGTVVANDIYGELSRSIVVMDDSAGIEIAIDSFALHELFPLYSRVEVYCSGLKLARVGHKVEMGAVATDDFMLDNIDAEMVNRYLRVVGVESEFVAPTLSIDQLSATHISGVVRIDDIEICATDRGLAWCDMVDGEQITTYRAAVDSRGNEFAIRTLGSCSYGAEVMPTEKFSAVGIVEYADSRYTLRIVNRWILK